ncbi:Rhamnogalacturonate lyase [Macleaya cordata]|uniref:rhamnogalacturonan endolyase n=1 Tax=Macleaya cordata TaxID=56857 RepID=A0A200QHT4_MACCD|nr:Rhamnogalacturonate lyase [Macleaya cordata]
MRFILMRGCSGFYSYAIYERLEGWPGFYIGETRIAFKLRKDKFQYMAISDNRRRVMPMPEDRSSGQKLDYPEAVLLTNPTNPILKGEVDDKYQYSSEDKDIRVHGWISSDPNIGFWVITPSDEFRTGGPLKQDLTSHVGPTSLAMFASCHYAGSDLEMKFEDGEPWKKVLGPVLIYLNSASDNIEDPHTVLWEDAKRQMRMEVESWPYSFPESEDFLKSSQRGTVNGRLLVHNRFSNEEYVWASYAYVGLARPGDAGSWQRETKGYQFWTRADANGSFSIRNVRPGQYNLYAWVPGFIGDYRYSSNLTVNPGLDNNLGVLLYEPPRDGPTIWEIGVPDRSAAEFFIPDPNPKYINRLYVKSFDKFRQYGLWERYTDLYPNEDLIYRIGVNDYTRDWFFAHSSRIGENSLQQTTWQIKFNLENVNYAGTYKLRISVAAATYAQIEVNFNNRNPRRPHFRSSMFGKDNAIARHGIHGLYWLFNIDVPSFRLIRGENTLYLTQTRTNGPFQGLMYDYIHLGSCGGLGSTSSFAVQLHIHNDHVIMDNGIVEVTLSKPEGFVTRVRYNGMDNVLEYRNHKENRGYVFCRITGTDFKVIREDENQVELSFITTWDQSLVGKLVPLNVDRRFILMRGCSGFYSYAIYERLEGWPGFYIGETRIAFKLRKDKFQYMAISDNRRRVMPMPEDRSSGQKLDYPEAVLLTNPTNPILKGEVDDKYQYSSEDKDIRVHGWISSDPNIGFWVITPSDEFRTGGPLKQDLTSHVGPTSLALFASCHYAGSDLEIKFEDGEPWKKVLGPVLIYLNSASDNIDDPHTALWEDAKRQMRMEVESWPYSFPESEDFLKSSQRGTVNGRLLVHNRFTNEEYVWASNAYIGLARPGDAGSWQRETKGYQFWTRADANGSFSIRNIRPGQYNLYAWVPGFIGDYRYDSRFNTSLNFLTNFSYNNLGVLLYEPPRDGPTIWEIGVPDRSAAEFFIPDPNPKYINRLYVDHIDRYLYMQYGLWDRYTDLYPNEDLIYRIGVSDYTRDWFFAHSSRRGENSLQQTTWQIKFNLANVNYAGAYKLRIALAAANYARLQVYLNDGNMGRSHFTSHMFGKDNAIARHGIHGLYWLFNIDLPSFRLVRGENTLYLTQRETSGPFQGIMYDYIRLEGPSV